MKVLAWMLSTLVLVADPAAVRIDQITQGPSHHFYGYIGQVGNTPWNGSGRYMVMLQTSFQEHMPKPDEAADIVLLDTQVANRIEKLDETRAWNFQQGTMLYWNPLAPETQFFFNDRDPKTNGVFCVLYDIAQRKRVREYRFADTPVGNSGVSQIGGFFLALNYGRLARLRPVTGYPEAWDWSQNYAQPENDGVWKVDVDSGARKLLISYKQMADALRPSRPDIGDYPLFVNHTLVNCDATLFYAYVRGGWEGDPRPRKVDAPLLFDLEKHTLSTPLEFIGGHPEWAPGNMIIGSKKDAQVVFDANQKKIVKTIGTKESIPTPGGDIALSPDGHWLVNGRRQEDTSCYSVINVETGEWFSTPCVPIGKYHDGELRIDPAPCWKRDGSALAVPGLASDGTRQTFVITIR